MDDDNEDDHDGDNGEDAEYPFRFYGAAPPDWFEGIQDYQLHFEVAPSAEVRLEIAGAFEAALSGNAAVSSQDIYPRTGWWWSGAHALCPLRRALTPGEDLGEFDGGIDEALRAVHEVAPLLEVVNLSARDVDADDDWTSWSLEQQEVPGPGPRWPQQPDPAAVFAAPQPTTPPEEPAVDPDFEAELGRARAGSKLDVTSSLARLALAAGKLALVPVAPADLPAAPARPSPPAEVVALCAKDQHSRLVCAPDQRTWVSFEWDGMGYAVALVADGVRRPVELLPWKMFAAQYAFVGQRLLLGGNTEIFAVDLGSGKVEVVLPGLYALSMGTLTVSSAGVIAAAATGSVHIFDPTQPEGSPRRYRTMRCNYPKELTFVAGDRALLVVEPGRRLGTAVLGLCDGAIRLLGRLQAAAQGVYQADGRIWSRSGLELVNLEATWQAAFPDGGLGPEADQSASISLERDW